MAVRDCLASIFTDVDPNVETGDSGISFEDFLTLSCQQVMQLS